MGYPLNHLIEDLVDRLITNNPTYAPAGPPDFNDAQLSAMASTCTDIATAVHNHILSWYTGDGLPFPDELVKANSTDPSAGYLVDKVDDFTIKVNPTTFRLYVDNLPIASQSVIGGIKITDSLYSCLYITNETLYVRTQQNLFNSNLHTEVPTVRAVKDYVNTVITNITGGTGIGDMLKIIYDQDDNGVVDNSERLGGQLPSYYLNYNNLTNTPTIDKYNFYQDLQINKNQLLNPVIHNSVAHIASPVSGLIYFNLTNNLLYFYNGTTWKPCFSEVDDFISLTEETLISSDDVLVIYDTSTSSYKKITRANFISGLGAGIANAYDKISDGTIVANASSNDTIRFRANTGMTVSVGSNDATYGDNVLYGLDLNAFTSVTSLVDADKVPVYISGTGNRNITYANLKSELNIDKFVKGPSSSSTGYIPTYLNTSANQLATGYSVETTLTGSSTAIPRADAVKAYVDSAIGGNFWSLNSSYLTPNNTSYLVSIPMTSGIYFGDNDTYIRQPSDDLLEFTLNNNTILSLYPDKVGVTNYIEIFRSILPYTSFGLLVHGNYNRGIVVTVGDLSGYYYDGIGTAYASLNRINTRGLELIREDVLITTTNDYSNFIHLESSYTNESSGGVLAGNFIGIIDHNPTNTANISKVLSVLCGTGLGSNIERLSLYPRVQNGATSIAYMLDTVSNLTFSGALLLSLRNSGVQKFSVDKDGNVNIPTGANYYINGSPINTILINNFTNNNLLTCGSSTNTLEGESTLTYTTNTHTLTHTYGTAADGLAKYYMIGSNTTTTGKALLELSTGSSLLLNNYGNSNTTTLFGQQMAGNSSIYTSNGDLYIGTYNSSNSIYLCTTSNVVAGIYGYNAFIGRRYTGYETGATLALMGNSATILTLTSWDTTSYNQVHFMKSRGAHGTWTPTTTSDILAEFKFSSVNSSNTLALSMYLRVSQHTTAFSAYNSSRLSIFASDNNSAPGVERFRFNPNGDLNVLGTVYSNQAIPSDLRLKYGFEEIENPLEKIKNLMGKKFRYTSAYKPDDDGKLHIGFIAQDVEKVLPEVINESMILGMGSTKYKMIAYDEIVPVLVEAVKELSKQVQQLSKNTIKNKRP